MSYVTDALSKLTSQFDNSPKVRALLSAIVGPLDDLQTDIDSVKTERWINSAIGSQLDGCGFIVGELRMGRDDDKYRAAIKFRVFVNVSNGTPPDLIKGLKYLIDSDDYQFFELYPATVMLFANGPFVPTGIQSQMQDLAPAATSIIPVMVSYSDSVFRFGKTQGLGELFVNSGTSYLTANGSDINVTDSSISVSGPTLSGVVPAELFAGDFQIDIGGSILVVNSDNHNLFLDSGSHLSGVFQ